MDTTAFLKSKQFKILFPFTVILGVIILVRTGYEFGQWLHQVMN